jgi:FkbM family methyltransferase
MSFTDRLLYKIFKIERSYSQTGEDKILRLLFTSFGKSEISYLDVGTNDPVAINNTYLFYQNGGSGLCVEPNPALCRLIEKARPKDKCLNVGIGVEDGSVADFYLMSCHTLSTFSKEEAEQLNAEGKYTIRDVLKVPLMTINTIIEKNFDSPPDLVSIDVEGWNEEIVRSFDFTRCRPFCFCVETVTFSDSFDGLKLTGIIDFFESNNYSVYADTRINTIFIDNEAYERAASDRLLRGDDTESPT